MTKGEQISAFIKKRFEKNSDWTNGNCYYFSVILKTRFPELDIYYLPIAGRFITGQNETFYDWTGEIDLAETPLKFDLIQTSDPVFYAQIVRDHIM